MQIKKLRLARNMSQAELASRIGLTPSRLSLLERPGAAPRPKTLLALAAALGISVDALLNEEGAS